MPKQLLVNASLWQWDHTCIQSTDATSTPGAATPVSCAAIRPSGHVQPGSWLLMEHGMIVATGTGDHPLVGEGQQAGAVQILDVEGQLVLPGLCGR